MARIRSIKPEFWTSEQVAEVSPIARLMFIGLWNFCDDAGIHPAAPRRIKMQIFPADAFSDDQINGWLNELISADLLQRYTVDGKDFLHVTGWRHQKIESPTYRFPKPPNFVEASPNGRRTVAEPSGRESSRVESSRTESSRGDGSRGERNIRSSTNGDDGDGDQRDSIDWDEAKRDANKALKKLGIGAHKESDRSLLIKAAALKQRLSHDWFWDAVEGTERRFASPSPPAGTRYGYIQGIWKDKCGALKPPRNFHALLKSIDVPPEILNPPKPPPQS